jgi:hypothetical protein
MREHPLTGRNGRKAGFPLLLKAVCASSHDQRIPRVVAAGSPGSSVSTPYWRQLRYGISRLAPQAIRDVQPIRIRGRE